MNITKIIEIKISQEDLRGLIEEKALSMGYQIKGEVYYDENGNLCTFADEIREEKKSPANDADGNGKTESENGRGNGESDRGDSSSSTAISQQPTASETTIATNATTSVALPKPPIDLPYKPAELAKPVVNPYQSITSSPIGTSPSPPANPSVQNMMAQFEKAKAQYQQTKKLN